MNVVTAKERNAPGFAGMLPGMLIVFAAMIVVGAMATGTVQGRADNFTDIFYTNSFRGAFEWIKKLDWVGMIVQAVISCFSLFGVALMVIRIMTSMLYLSAKGLWEEVSELKNGAGGGEKDFLGMFGLAKNWASGKAGTGVDAIIGAVMILLPDVKKYSDFGEKAGGDFSTDMTITQYILKIALPTVMTVFFFAMGFNGTLFQALAVTVDMLGSFADKAISVNYAGFVDDLVNSRSGYQFYFDADGTNLGKFKQTAAKDAYYNAVSGLNNATPDQLYQIGLQVEEFIKNNLSDPASFKQYINGLDEKVGGGLEQGGTVADNFMSYVSCSVMVTSSDTQTNAYPTPIPITEWLNGIGLSAGGQERVEYIHFMLTQDSTYNGAYFNMGDLE